MEFLQAEVHYRHICLYRSNILNMNQDLWSGNKHCRIGAMPHAEIDMRQLFSAAKNSQF